jgi:dGTPase
MCLVASGGHSHIILVEDYTTCKVIGQTRDDAAGEAFDKVARVLDETVKPMMQKMYYKLLDDLKKGNTASPVFKHHVDFVQNNHYAAKAPYIETEPNQIVVDYMASMTDDYCTELYHYLYPESKLDVVYHGYFEDLTI